MSARIQTAVKNAVYQSTEVNAGNSPALNLNFGAMMGAMPRYGYRDTDGNHYGEWISATPYTRENIVPILLSYPKIFDWLPDTEEWVGMLKAMMEVQAQSIDGLKSTITVDTESHAIGGAGEQFDIPTNVTRERSEPSYTWKERMGRPYTKFLNFWVEYGIMDPDTKRAKVLRYFEDYTSNERFTLYTPEYYTASVLYIEPSNQFTTVEKSWLCFNMFPKGSLGAVEGRRDVTTAKDTLDISISFAAITLTNDAVALLAKKLLNTLVSLYEIQDLDQTLPIVAVEPLIENKSKVKAHSADTLQGNGDLAWDTHPGALS